MTDILAPILGEVLAQWFTWAAANGGLIVLGPVLIEFLKQTERFPWLTAHSDTANRVWSAVFAIASTVGIGYAYDAQGGTFTLTGVSPQGLGRFLVEAGVRFGGQEAFYRYALKAVRR